MFVLSSCKSWQKGLNNNHTRFIGHKMPDNVWESSLGK